MPHGQENWTLQLFDPGTTTQVTERSLPHWAQAGTITFITWRTWDSIPKSILTRFLAERTALLRRLGIETEGEEWREKLQHLGPTVLREFQQHVVRRWNDSLDAGHGECVLRIPTLARIVENSLRHFDGQKYSLTDYAIMPNHVHLLVAFPDDESLLRQCESWKHFTATQINKQLGRKGRFWQQDGFDHLVRSQAQFNELRRYIADNPRKAHLGPDQFIHYSRQIECTDSA